MASTLIDLEILIRQAQTLQPLPASLTRLAALVAGPDWSIEEVVEAIAFDEALTVELLQLANAAAFAGREEIATVKEAVVRLGAGRVLSLATAATVRQPLQRALPQFGLDEGQLWSHSVAAAIALEEIASLTDGEVPGGAFTAALLHDVGKLVMARYLDASIVQALGRARGEGGLTAHLAERELLGVEHGELGGLMLQAWGLPRQIGLGVQYHHDPSQCPGPVAAFVHLSNLIAHRALRGLSASDPPGPPPPEILEQTGVSHPSRVEAAAKSTADRILQVLSRYD